MGVKGKWAGLSAVVISQLMKTHPVTTRRNLYRLRKKLNKIPTLGDLGDFIFRYREKVELKLIKKHLK